MQITLKVSGMTCGHCKQSVNDALSNLEGVQSVEVNLDSGNVDVAYEDSLVSKEQLIEIVEDQGYDVVA
ncbi:MULTISPECIES: copper chaperone CopZ [Allobacillus]|uniref:Copper chaperone CopZ n=1 Tax=Allobacillus halotolerans TaxID=570278 RepID=A0ABS6GPR5_9BACI|nr:MULTISPECIES: copper chaperone CopZ [Allobacillus]MBU6080437.1 copper chaperone CopZ [Allobacillus halotolerans]TSJ65919.1 copper chaperone CopZ [Allobacillus sp. SKP2-8]